MIGLVVGFVVLPHLPDDGQPAIGQPTVCIGIGATAGAEIAPISQSPARLPHGGLGELLGNAPELTVAAATEDDDLALPALLGDGAGTGQGLNAGRCGEAITVVPELGQQSRKPCLTCRILREVSTFGATLARAVWNQELPQAALRISRLEIEA